jgi:flagellar basal body rod protein FlgC
MPADKKRSFTIQGSDITFEGGNYKGDTPKAAARKAAKRLFALAKDKNSPYHKYHNLVTIKFILREKTRGSDKKTYFYEANVHELKGDEIKYIKVKSPDSEDADEQGYVQYPVTKEIKVATCTEPHFSH